MKSEISFILTSNQQQKKQNQFQMHLSEVLLNGLKHFHYLIFHHRINEVHNKFNYEWKYEKSAYF